MNSKDDFALEHILKYSIGIIKLKYLQHLRVNKTISLDENLRYSEKRPRHDIIASNKLTESENIFLSEDDTIITVMEKCFSYGLNREETLVLIKNRFQLKDRDVLEVLKKELLSRNNLRTTKEDKVYLADKEEELEH